MTNPDPRIGAVAITPPVFKASGGVSAGVHLTQRVARLCATRMFIMAVKDDTRVADGLHIDERRSENRLLPLARVIPRSLTSAAWRPRLREWLREWRPDLVHLHNPHPPGALAAAAESCRAEGIPYVISTHGFVEFDAFARGMGLAPWRTPLYEHLIRRPVARVARGAARVLMLSPEETPILRRMGVLEEKLCVVSNGVDPYFREALSPGEISSLTARFRFRGDVPRMLFVGNHTRNKGLDILLRAVTQMREPAVAVIAGAIRSGREHRQLLGECRIASDDPRVAFTDFISKEELRALYQSVDIFVFPSRADTLPLVVLEAMASGLPVVSTRVGGIPYEVTPETGLLVEPGDWQALARALDDLCGNAALRARMGAAGSRRAITTFDWTVSATRAVEIYREVLGL